ncbi:MAG: single-stranded DNA-binding protein [Ferruginibacter sp.]
MIKLQIIGNLGADCITKEVNGKNVINFNVAHSEKFKDSQGVQKEKTTWVNCAYWTDRTAVAQYLLKGKTVYAEGFPEVDQYTNKDGQPAVTLRMRVMNLQLLGGNTEGQGANTGNVSYSGSAPAPTQRTENAHASASMPVDDDLPF